MLRSHDYLSLELAPSSDYTREESVTEFALLYAITSNPGMWIQMNRKSHGHQEQPLSAMPHWMYSDIF